MKAKWTGIALSLVLCAALFAGCGRSGVSAINDQPAAEEAAVTEEPTPEPVEEEPEEEPIEAETVEEEENPLPEGMMYSLLTGEVVPWEYALKRPFAIMINNLNPAVPQSGIAGADIMYECYVEGNITRLMAIYQDPSPYSKIGPLRSARHYYLDYMDDYEANYVHFGWSYAAEYKIDVEGRTSINGTNYDGSWGFFRTDDRVAPHNAYVDGAQLADIAADKGMRLDYGGYYPVLSFNREDTVPETGEDASGTVTFPYPVNNPWFEYNEDEKVYYRYLSFWESGVSV